MYRHYLEIFKEPRYILYMTKQLSCNEIWVKSRSSKCPTVSLFSRLSLQKRTGLEKKCCLHTRQQMFHLQWNHLQNVFPLFQCARLPDFRELWLESVAYRPHAEVMCGGSLGLEFAHPTCEWAHTEKVTDFCLLVATTSGIIATDNIIYLWNCAPNTT